MFEWLSDPNAWIALATLTALGSLIEISDTDRRRVLLGAQLLTLLCSAGLAVNADTGPVLWPLFALPAVAAGFTATTDLAGASGNDGVVAGDHGAGSGGRPGGTASSAALDAAGLARSPQRFESAHWVTRTALVVEARAACPAALVHRDELLDHFAACLDDNVRRELPEGATPAAISAAGVVGGIEALLYSRLNREETGDLVELLPSLMYFAVLPYEGHDAAAEELAAPVA